MEKKAQCEFQKDCHNNKESGVSYDESWLDELLLSNFHQRRSLAAFLTNFHIDKGTKKYWKFVPFKHYKKHDLFQPIFSKGSLKMVETNAKNWRAN